jgi:hypothetical protein
MSQRKPNRKPKKPATNNAKKFEAVMGGVRAHRDEFAGHVWEKGIHIADIFDQELWKHREPRYLSFDAFAEKELKMEGAYARELAGLARTLTKEQFVEQARAEDSAVREVMQLVEKAISGG